MGVIYVCTRGKGKHNIKEENLLDDGNGGFCCPEGDCNGKLFTLVDSEADRSFTLRIQLFKGEPDAMSIPEEELMFENDQPLDRPDSITQETWIDFVAAVEAVKARLEK